MSEEKLFDDFQPVSTEEWEKIIERDLKGADYKKKLNWQTGEGIEALPFYRRENRPQNDVPLLPADHHWKICQTIYDADVEIANRSAKKVIEGGAQALRFRVKMESVSGNIGPDMSGTAVQSQEDFSRLLNDISIKETELHFNAGLLSPVFSAMLLNECEKREINPSEVSGTFGYDPFSFMLKHSRLPNSEEVMADRLKQLTEFCDEHLPNMKSLAVNGETFRNAGSTIAQELGYALAAGSEYLALLSGSSDKDEASHPPESLSNSSRDSVPLRKEDASAIHFNFSVGSYYFPEIAKFRAARKLWPKILQAYDISDVDMMIHAETSIWNKTQRDSYSNMLRDTTEGMAAALGGCDSITVAPFDAVFRQPDEFSHRIARNTQLILKHEAYFDKVSDPAAGSWHIETLTDKIAEAAWKTFQEVEQQGGLLESIKEGTLQTAIADARKEKDEAITKQKRIFVGANKYINRDEMLEVSGAPAGHKTVSMHQTEDGATIDNQNLLPSIKEALNDGAPIGDIAPALFDMGSVQFKTLQPYRAEEIIENDE